MQERGTQLEDGASKAASIAKRIERLDWNIGTAIRHLGKAEIISNLRAPARAMKKTLDLGLPDYSGMLNDVTVWNEFMAELRNLLNMPSIFQCAEAHGVVEQAPPVGEA